jgi:hypothetical protein
MLTPDPRSSRSARFALAGLLCLALSLPAVASADSICIAKDDTPYAVPGDPDTVLGSLRARTCWTVVDRAAGRTRIWIKQATGFQGEVEISDRALAYIVLDDLDLRLAPSDEPHGELLSGAVVVIEKELGGDHVLARLLEGRVGARFVASYDDLYHAESWPEPEPDLSPGSGWPTATQPVPPEPVAITQTPGGYDVLAKIGAPLFHVADILLDPGLGQVKMEYVEQAEHEAKVRIVGPYVWVEGWVTDLDWREAPEKGYDPLLGVPSVRSTAVGTRQIGDKDADLAPAPKADAVGAVRAGSWLNVVNEDGGWAQVTSAWDGGNVTGWIQKKHLLSEKKAGTPPSPEFSRVSAVSVGNVAVQWFDAEGHETEGQATEPDLSVDVARGLALTRIDELRHAYGMLLAEKPELTGELTAKLVVDVEGVLLEQSFPVAKLESQQLTELLDGILEGTVFPVREVPRRSKLDHNVVVWVQFLFKPLGK